MAWPVTPFLLSSVDQLEILALVGAVAGLTLFYRGFRLLQRKRLIQNTPTSKIRSASLGLVEISGLATGPYTIPAPITGRSSYYYRTLAWELRKSGKNNEWHKIADESLHVPFYLDDNTGQVLVNPQGAEMDIHRDFHQEYGQSLFSENEMPPEVRSFVIRYGASGDRRIRVDEYCIKPKNALFVLGTLGENPGLEVGPKPIRTERPAIATLRLELPGGNGHKASINVGAGPGVAIPEITVRTETSREVIQLPSGARPTTSAEMTQQGKIAAALLKAGISNPAAWSAAGIDNSASAIAAATQGASPSGTTTAAGAAPAPEEFDLHPKVVLMKGENNSAFFISWRSQRNVVAALGWKSIAYIWGGPALTLVSVYILLAQVGWL